MLIIKFTQEDIDNIIKLYTIDKMYITTIKDIYHCKATSITNLLKNNGIDIRSRAIRVNKFLNEDYFKKIDTEAKAYLLGFLTADGSVTYRKRKTEQATLKLEVNIRDAEVINLLKTELNCESKLFYRKKNNSETVSVSISSLKVVKDLEKYFITPNKTYLLNKIYDDFETKELLIHYMRGLIDGDGAISYNKYTGKSYIYLCGYSKDFVESFRIKLNSLIKNKANNNTFDAKSAYRCSWANDRAKSVCELLYSNCNCYLTRKYNLANVILDRG